MFAIKVGNIPTSSHHNRGPTNFVVVDWTTGDDLFQAGVNPHSHFQCYKLVYFTPLAVDQPLNNFNRYRLCFRRYAKIYDTSWKQFLVIIIISSTSRFYDCIIASSSFKFQIVIGNNISYISALQQIHQNETKLMPSTLHRVVLYKLNKW